MMSEFSKRMGVTQSAFKKAQADIMRGGGMPKPGRYQCRITEAGVSKVSRGKATGKYASNMKLKILTGEEEGREFFIGRFLETVKKGRRIGLSMLLGDLEILGIECGGIADVEEAVKEAKGLIVEVRVYQNGQYTNAQLDHVIDDGEVETKDDEEMEEEEEEVEDEEEETEDDEDEEEEEEKPEEKPTTRRKAGRPKGSKNTTKKEGKKKNKEAAEDPDFDDDFLEAG